MRGVRNDRALEVWVPNPVQAVAESEFWSIRSRLRQKAGRKIDRPFDPLSGESGYGKTPTLKRNGKAQKMNWFAAHIIMTVNFKEGKQTRFPVWENIVLIEAKSAEQAFDKAERRGREEEGDCDGTFRWEGKPATWVFAGVRKLVECAMMGDRPGDGDEISYNEMELASKRDVERFASGEAVDVRLNKPFSSFLATPSTETRNIGRKGA